MCEGSKQYLTCLSSSVTFVQTIETKKNVLTNEDLWIHMLSGRTGLVPLCSVCYVTFLFCQLSFLFLLPPLLRFLSPSTAVPFLFLFGEEKHTFTTFPFHLFFKVTMFSLTDVDKIFAFAAYFAQNERQTWLTLHINTVLQPASYHLRMGIATILALCFHYNFISCR